jgi:hypothetical protein
MTQSSESEFSVLGTAVHYDAGTIEKSYKPNVNLGVSLEDIKKQIDLYIQDLNQAGVPLPKVINSGIRTGKIHYQCEAKGQNIIELGFTPDNADDFREHFKSMLKVIDKAANANLAIDPHPKNFVFEDESISYVDFYPPYGNVFDNWRLAIVQTEAEKDIVSKNLSYFQKPYLAQHFCGDFLNIDRNSVKIFKTIYEIAIELKLFTGSFSEFETEATQIRALEDQRIAADIYLV